jgi:hypothetical protein
MDSASADAQVALGTVLFLSEWDWAAAERSLQRALQRPHGTPNAPRNMRVTYFLAIK